MPVEWPQAALAWLFTQLLKWNRSACPRVCVISMSFAYVNRPRLLLRGCTERRSRLDSRSSSRSKWERMLPLVPPSQTRCLGRSNTGRSLDVLPPLSHAARPAHQLLSADSPTGFTAKQRKNDQPLHPGKVGTHSHLLLMPRASR